MINGLAVIKKSEPIARKRDSKKTPRGPRLPIQVQTLCNAGTTGKKNEVTASPIARTTVIVSFFANEVTKIDWRLVSAATRKPQAPVLFDNMSVYQPGKFEHVDFFLSVEDGFQSFIGFDELFFLKFVLFDVFPKFFGEFRPGNRTFANNPGQRRIRLYRLHECAFCFTFV
jgi:hypothetical protein